MQLFILPHTLVGIGILGGALLAIAVALFGTRVPATIYDLSTSRNSKGVSTYQARYEYRYNGVNHQGKQGISATIYQATSKGQTAIVKILPVLPGTGSILMLPGSNSFTGLVMVPVAILWNGILLVFYFAMYGQRVKDKALVRRGLATQGRVVDRKIVRGKNTTYTVEYEYRAARAGSGSLASVGPWGSSSPVSLPSQLPAQPGESAPLRRKMTVSKEDYEALEIGHEITVLHDANKPKRSIIYECANYSAAS